jgi:O-antigen ligase
MGSQVPGDNAFFKPARWAMTIIDQKDSSSESRVVENFNLVYTFRDSPWFGQGFGHEYLTRYNYYDLSDVFPLFKYIPHNGVLWLWSVGGLFWTTPLWLIYPLVLAYAVRTYRNGKHPADRMAGLTAVAISCTALFQVWGDQGLHSYMTSVLMMLAYAMSAKIGSALEGGDQPTRA